MLKEIAFLIGLAIPATASADARRTYDVRATSPGPSGERSCGATRRMLRDRHTVALDGYQARVDGFKWIPWSDDERWRTISFHETNEWPNGEWQHTVLIMDLYVNDRGLTGMYILQGRLPDGRECSDSVNIRGTRR